jgi:type II secretory pathway pseudopilin PulG
MVVHRHQRGFTYLLALFAVGIAGLIAIRAVPLVETFDQREKEAELLYIGQQFRKAIGSYYQSSPGMLKRYPDKLEDLLIDRRFVSIRRHLRRIYTDPFTRNEEWGLVRDTDGAIMGLYSLYDTLPIKQGGFRAVDADLAGARSYRAWQFVYHPPVNQ